MLHSCLVIHHLLQTVFHRRPVLQVAGHLYCKDSEHKYVLSTSLESVLENAQDQGKALWDSLMD